jgi:hypothetical protein
MPSIINPSDRQTSILLETVAGTTPTTGTRYILPVTSQNLISFTSADIASNAVRPNGAKNGSQRGPITGQGTIEMPMMFGPAYHQLLESSLRGKFTTTGTKTLKPGTTDSTFSIAQLLQPGSASNALLDVAKGSTVTQASLSATAGEGATISFEMMAAAQDLLTSDIALAATDLPGVAYEFTFKDINNIVVAANSTLAFKNLTLEWGQPRANRYKLGSLTSLGNAPSEQRTVTLTLRAYRDSFAVETLLTGDRQAFSFNIGPVGAGYGFFVYGQASIPSTELDSESAYVNITVTGAYDSTALADMYITQL